MKFRELVKASPRVVTGPSVEPVSLALFKEHVRRSDSQEDDLLNLYIEAARRTVETRLARALITQTLALDLDYFPDDCIELRRPPIQSVTSVVYVDENGDSQTYSSANYNVDARGEPGRIELASGATWPVTYDQPNAVTVTFVAGYGSTAAAVPGSVRQAILMIALQASEYRLPVVSGTIITKVPDAVTDLIADAVWGAYG